MDYHGGESFFGRPEAMLADKPRRIADSPGDHSHHGHRARVGYHPTHTPRAWQHAVLDLFDETLATLPEKASRTSKPSH
jgi:hypothetical protein